MKLIWVAFFLIPFRVLAGEISYQGRSFLHNIGEEVKRILPSQYLASIQTEIKIIEKKNLTENTLSFKEFCSTKLDTKLTELKENKILISSELVSWAEKDHFSFECAHKTAKKTLLASIIHQLTLLKDNREKLSLQPDFQRLVGVKKIKKRQNKRSIHLLADSLNESLIRRSLSSIFATNIEYFLLDPEYECRKPASAKFFSEILGHKPIGKCQKNDKILLQSAFPEDNYQRAVSLRRDKVYQIHYLFAGQGKAIMSRWGHAMFRVVMCAPHRKKMGPECLNDLSHHLVLNYRAKVDDVNINYAKGIFGRYPSQMFVQSYLEILQEYTKFELRDLYSIPLKLSDNERDDFINMTLERFWSYQGKYYFLTNNCGTEALKHLNLAMEDGKSKLINSLTPLSMFNDIINQKNDLSVLQVQDKTRQELIEKGILVEGQYQKLNKTFNYLKSYLNLFSELNFREFISKLTIAERLKIYQDSLPQLESFSEIERLNILTKIHYLERYLFSKYFYELSPLMIKNLNETKQAKDLMDNLMNESTFLSMGPWDIIRTSYGVPSVDEFEIQFNFFKLQYSRKKSSQNNLADSWMEIMLNKPEFSVQAREISQMKKINSLISENLGTLIPQLNTQESL